ncbi:Fe2+-dependent dioxygenase [Piscinibacter terrae]|uniref:Fe2+-dependent dioxygenase n=1 Tax=Piscinibacter terrae TaxID=2496871 RepID=A0A3N7HX57_9BURK|nr:Fe2+-dependent dioxygenase [Albitalea terrae]RQP26026.1 Fe2+-dependent dioxygenase [Albitalea terrae]
MIVQLPDVLTHEQVLAVRSQLLAADWVSGLATAGHQGAPVKNNRQLREGSPLAAALGDVVLAALEKHPLFISAALPAKVYPPMFNRYEGGEAFGNHVDNAIRLMPGSGERIRTDLSATLFLCEPLDYDGGELLIEDVYGAQSVKLPAGHMVLYPSTSLHRVEPVTRGARLACFFWVQSMVRDAGQRSLLLDMDTSIQRLAQTGADEGARVQLTGCYHNLLRMWASP